MSKSLQSYNSHEISNQKLVRKPTITIDHFDSTEQNKDRSDEKAISKPVLTQREIDQPQQISSL